MDDYTSQNIVDIPQLPPGEYEDTDVDETSSIQALDDVPIHLRELNNASQPIEINGSDGPDDSSSDHIVSVDGAHPRKKKATDKDGSLCGTMISIIEMMR